jgi:GTPase SAR1 family protein
MAIKIPIDTAKKDFSEFLSMEENSRIIFSGKSGAGKTHFLNEFFKENYDSYEMFHLYPINYQISTNDDIISLLKYDIVIELLKKKKDIFEEKPVNGIKESSLLFWSWIKDRYIVNDVLQKVISGG